MPSCRNCQQNFTIYPADRVFYNKFEVPEPTFCPACREQQRLAFRSNFIYHSRPCDLCHKTVICPFSPDAVFPVYCPDCWWSDKWDRYQHGRDYDFSRPFFDQYKELLLVTPRLTSTMYNCQNCDYAFNSANSKNCYLVIGCEGAEECYYGEKFIKSKDCLDSIFILQCELSYYCLDSKLLFNCNFCQDCSRCSDCNFCYDCRNCHDCFMCWNLRNKQFYILNKQYSETEYRKKIAEFNLGSYNDLQRVREGFKQEKEKQSINRFVRATRISDNSTGNYLFGVNNCWRCFNIFEFKDSRYASDDENGKDMVDTNNCGGGGELCYQVQDAYNNHFCRFGNILMSNSFIDYCFMVHNSKNCFGCSCIDKAEFCILNKKYPEKEYFKLKEKIISQMKKGGEWGEFFRPDMSCFSYQQTKANLFYPLTKDKALAGGWNWQEESEEITGAKMVMSDLPDKIGDVGDDIINQVLTCAECGKNYKIIKQELDFYRKKNLPLPRKCFRCRYFELFNWRNPRKLYHRQCMNAGCKNEFETTFAPERIEKVYCEECYQKEIY